MTRIEVFADVVCPFAHVGLRRVFDARRDIGADQPIRVYAWPLEWVNGEPLAVDRVSHHIDELRAQVAPELFAGFDPSTFPRSSIPALRLVAAAYATSERVGEAMSLAVRDLLFEQGRDICDEATLADLAARQGVAPMPDDATEAEVRRELELGRTRGVRGSPHFFVGDHDWFCPGLDIDSTEGHLEIAPGKHLREFYLAAFT